MKMKDIIYDVSIVIVTYNSQWDALLSTIKSIINQIGIEFEIVIADDGSKDNKFKMVRQYFSDHNFTNYRLVENKINEGTVSNLMSGLRVAMGKYIKTISPGDLLYSKDTLQKWMVYMEQYNYDWTFSDATYYTKHDGNRLLVSVPAHPQNVAPYLKKNKDECRWSYIVLDDIAMGASMLCRRDIQITYCEKILGKVIYAEDNMWRMMMFDDILGGYYPEKTIYYEYGTGISTANNDVWNQRLMQDWLAADIIMFDESRKLDQFQRKMIQAVHNNKKGRLSKLMVKGKLKQFVYSKLKKRMTED